VCALFMIYLYGSDAKVTRFKLGGVVLYSNYFTKSLELPSTRP
jgi:hypothetical protein